MTEQKEVITRICFKRDKQLLSDTAANHKRNLLLFSSTAIGLILISWFSGFDKVTSIFGIRFEDDMPVSIITFSLLPPIIYELIQFYLHCDKSINVFTESIKLENSELSIDRHCFSTRNNDVAINQLLNDTLPNLGSRLFERVTDAVNKKNELFNERIENIYSAIEKCNQNIDELHKKSESNVSNYSDTIDDLTKKFKDDLFIIEHSISSIKTFTLDQQSHIKTSLVTSHINFSFDIEDIKTKIEQIIAASDNYVRNSKYLANELVKKSMGPKDLYLMEIFLPSTIALSAILLCVVYSYANWPS